MEPSNPSTEVQRLEAEKQKFFQVVSQWLGSPLRSLNLLTDMVASQKDDLDPKQSAEFHFHIHNQVVKLSGLMQNLIAWSDIETGNFRYNPKAIRLAEVFESLKSELEVNADKKDISLTFKVDPNLHVLGDKFFLRLALHNLITNAIKFTPSHASVHWGAEAIGGEKVRLFVEDKGVGMGPSKLNNIFDAARPATQKGTANEDGMGIGLILTKKIVELHHSTLQMESKRGEGTRAAFVLPVEKEE